jgi:hypothetical protein
MLFKFNVHTTEILLYYLRASVFSVRVGLY